METGGIKPPQQPSGKYRVILKEAPDLAQAVKVVARRIGGSEDQLSAIVRKLPAEVATNLDPLYAEDLVGALKDIGAVAEKKIIPSSVICSAHPGQPGRALCAVCGKVLCRQCVADADGQALCAEHSGKAKVKLPSTFRWVRFILLLILVGVGAYAYYVINKERAPFPFDRPYKLAVVGYMVSLPESWKNYVSKFNESAGKEYVDMENHTLPDMTGWFQKEYARYGGGLPQAVDLTIFGPFDEDMSPPPPPKPDAKFLERYTQWRKFKKYFDTLNQKHDLNLKSFDGVIYVEFVQGGFEGFLESWASKRANMGLVRCFLNRDLIEQNIMVVIHEFFHLLNAQDHYDENGAPKIPEGLADPYQDPPYPQKFADVMAGRIADENGVAREIKGLMDLRVNFYTAHEIGWINDEDFQKALESRQIPSLE